MWLIYQAASGISIDASQFGGIRCPVLFYPITHRSIIVILWHSVRPCPYLGGILPIHRLHSLLALVSPRCLPANLDISLLRYPRIGHRIPSNWETSNAEIFMQALPNLNPNINVESRCDVFRGTWLFDRSLQWNVFLIHNKHKDKSYDPKTLKFSIKSIRTWDVKNKMYWLTRVTMWPNLGKVYKESDKG